MFYKKMEVECNRDHDSGALVGAILPLLLKAVDKMHTF